MNSIQSTLRFADRAKTIKTRAVVNESPTEKLIRELREGMNHIETMTVRFILVKQLIVGIVFGPSRVLINLKKLPKVCTKTNFL